MIARAVAAAWGLAVTAALVLPAYAVRDRLPDPMATHWSGTSPDGSNSFTGHVLVSAGVWVVPAVAMVVLSGRAQVRRASRMTWWGLLFGTGVLLMGAQGSTLSANLDVPDWTAATLPGWHIAAILGGMLAATASAAVLAKGEPDEPAPGSQAPPVLRLRSGQRAVWVSRVVNRGLTAAVVAVFAVTVVMTLLGLRGQGGSLMAAVLPGAVILLVVGLATMAVSVRVGDGLIRIGFGPFGWPARRIRLSSVESAWAERRSPADAGGWGFRGVPGAATIMLRGGECLVLRYRSGGQLAISIDDAERGAALINALVAERAQP
ncbi:hypothetical protein AB0K18_01760 [Nonomuraea sp. NPDC049421]|uniref:hypothetical protein n=1 Tax=Nonomuraea sp. NPDC049421 TaxID=3155275 RepID=UPI0034167E41